MKDLLTSYSIDIDLPFSKTISILLILVIGALTIYSIKNLLPYLTLRVRVFLSTLRIMAVLSFLFVFFQPSIIETTYYLEKDTVAILIDASRSMSYKSREKRRLDIAKEIGKKLYENKELNREHRVVLYTFSKNLHLMDQIDRIEIINEDSTDIINSLEGVKLKHQDISNIFLISDGADNNLLSSPNLDTNSFLKRYLRNLNIPVYTILPGSDQAQNDISINISSSPPVGFIGKPFEIILDITNNSNISDSIPVVVKENGTPVYSGNYRIKNGEKRQISISIFPKNIGRNVYEVSVPPLAGEEYTYNNSDYFTVRITKEIIRILQITGSVSYDVRFLRHLFKKDPNIDLVSFFILRTLNSDVNAPDSELSLIPFPADSVIRDNLLSFDVIIFQDFGFVPYGLNTTFSDINKFVKNGGGLLFITGNNWYKWIGDFISFFDECMPAVPRIDDNAIENIIYKPELTAPGKTHSVTRILNSLEENTLLYKNLPDLHGIHRVNNIKSSSLTLMAARISEAERAPLLMLNRCERGRTALVLTDELWRFSFSEKTPDEFNLYNKLMYNLIQWLAAEPNKEELIISQTPQSDRERRLNGRLTGTISGSDIILQDEDGTQIRGKITDSGDFSFDISKLKEGFHSGIINYQQQVYRTYFYKKDPDLEMRDISIKGEILKSIARYSGGRQIKAEDVEKGRLDIKKKPIKKIQSQNKTPLWNRGIFFALFILLFTLEWFFRRMHGHQ